MYTYSLKCCGHILLLVNKKKKHNFVEDHTRSISAMFVFKWFNSVFFNKIFKTFFCIGSTIIIESFELNQHYSFWELFFIYFLIDSNVKQRIMFTFTFSSIKFVGSNIIFIDFTQWVQS